MSRNEFEKPHNSQLLLWNHKTYLFIIYNINIIIKFNITMGKKFGCKKKMYGLYEFRIASIAKWMKIRSYSPLHNTPFYSIAIHQNTYSSVCHLLLVFSSCAAPLYSTAFTDRSVRFGSVLFSLLPSAILHKFDIKSCGLWLLFIQTKTISPLLIPLY